MKKGLAAFKKIYQGKKVLIMGLGLLGGGVGDANFMAEIGARVTITDLKTQDRLQKSLAQLQGDFQLKLGGHDPEDFKNTDVIIKNPGVKPDSQFLALARHNHIKIKNSVALFADFFPGFLVGITGTRGKSTTTQLIYLTLKAAGKPVFLGGNVTGQSTLSQLKNSQTNQIAVLELSSWILQGFAEEKISPQLAVITNIYQDHLNYYANMVDYIKDKKAIFKYQRPNDTLILNQDNPRTTQLASEVPGKLIWFSARDWPDDWPLKLPGEHNRENAAAALKTLRALGIKKQTISQTIGQFTGLPHRLESVAIIKGIEFINDTTSTTPTAGQKALESITKPIILLAGGNGKNLDMKAWVKDLVARVKGVVLLEGSATDDIEKLMAGYGGRALILTRTANFEQAIEQAFKSADAGDVVLLSPGCTSFGMFVNEFDRGNQFITLVKKLKAD